MNTVVAIAVGLTLGVRHATDADHIVALSTLLRGQAGVRGALSIGAVWGLGHTLVLLAAGVAIVLLGVAVPPGFDRLAELGVAAMLVTLGLLHLRPRCAGELRAGEHVATHARPLLIGMVHGLAGSAGVALLALTTIPARSTAMIYLGLFGLGTIAGMMALTGLMSVPLRYAGRSARFQPWIVRAASVASLGLGIFLAVRCSFYS